MTASSFPAGDAAAPRLAARDPVPAWRPDGRPDAGVEDRRRPYAVAVVLPDGECVEELFWPQDREPARRPALHPEVA